MSILKVWLGVSLAVAIALPAFAEDEPKSKKAGGKGAMTLTAQVLKQLTEVGLTEEQTAKIKAMGKTAEEAIKQLNKDAEITAKLLKARREATAALKDSEKKGKARAAAINEAAGFNEAQAAAIVKANEVRAKFKADILKLLTAEQKAKVPEAFQPAGQAKGKAGKRKAAAQ